MSSAKNLNSNLSKAEAIESEFRKKWKIVIGMLLKDFEEVSFFFLQIQ